jgi:purine nucleosidase
MSRPIIIDTDPGTDDAIALLLAFAAPELDLRAITVCGGNVGLARTLDNALRLKALGGGRAPVYAGADRPLRGAFADAAHVHDIDGLGGIALPAGAAPAPGIAADAIRRILRDSGAPVTLIGIGPATNLALALATEPGLTARVAEIVLMTGSRGLGNVTAQAEFNAWSDPEALAILLAAGAPLTLVTLDLTHQARVTGDRIARLRAAGLGASLRIACDILAAVPAERLDGGYPLHDPCAIAWLIAPALFTPLPARASVVLEPAALRGRTLIDWRDGQPANATWLQSLDVDGFFAVLAERLATLP